MKKTTFLQSIRLSLLPLVLIATVLFAAGCETLGGTSRMSKGVYTPPPPPSAYEQAHKALLQGDFSRAEMFAQRAVQEKSTPQTSQGMLYMVYAKAASINKHPSVALAALDNWRLVTQGADATALWQEVWHDSITQLYPREGIMKAETIVNDAKRTQPVHNLAYAYSAAKQWEQGALADTLTQLTGRYEGTSAPANKALFEAALARELLTAQTAAISLVASAVTPENQATFPYNIILIDQLRRQLQNPATQAEAQQALARLQGTLNLADPTLVNGPKSSPIPAMAERFTPTNPIESGPISGKPVVLALPLSGPFATIATKIAAGAEVACKELSAGGTQTSLVVINTDQPDWLARIDGLPKDVTLIGGPLRASDYTTAKGQGATSRKAFFAFLPSLDGADEGRVAWRFFTSASDQVGALVALASRMGITGFATLYPDEPYGHKMAELFEREGRSAGGINFQQAPYSPKNSSAWVQATASLLATNKNPESASSATFRAIFLPDSWKNMEVIVPSIHQFGETRQLLLGTTLWEQALKAKVPANIQLYSFAVFPGAWNDAAPSHAASQLNAGLASMGKGRADFWSGLGYDYARFAATFATSGAVNASEINANLMRVNMQWSMGAINWDGSGIAKQSLYLFTPSESGFAPLDEAEFTSRYNSVWK